MQTGTLRDKDVGKIASDYEQLIWVFIYFRLLNCFDIQISDA